MLELLPGWHVLPPPPGLTSATTLGGGLAGAPGTALGLFPHLREGCACPGDSRSLGFGEREITVGNLSKPRGASEEKDGYFPCAALSGPFCSAHITSGPRNEATLLPPAPLVLGAAERDHPDVGGGVSPLRIGVASGLCRHGCVASAFVGRWACDGREAQARGCPFPLPSNRGETSFPSIWRRDQESGPCARSVGKRPGLSGLTRCQMQHRG